MLETLIWSLLVGSLGIESLMAAIWLRSKEVAIQQQQEEEDEFLVQYDSKEGHWEIEPSSNNGEVTNPFESFEDFPVDWRASGWEYKIVRTSRDLFGNPAFLQRVRDEEAEAGWILLEKLDDRRIRFKRSIAFGQALPLDRLRFDPYRSHVGPTGEAGNWFGVVVVLLALALPAYLGYQLVETTLHKSRSNQPSHPTQQVIPTLPKSAPPPMP
ncbi:hypothetical protein CKA32_002570 [Geitlerinema sp. FC II]|nr:hypothetical protein CKA32_002570 [Geitlerinema sp. FC II]